MRVADSPRTSSAVDLPEAAPAASPREEPFPWPWSVAALLAVGLAMIGLLFWPVAETRLTWNFRTLASAEGEGKDWTALQCLRENINVVLVQSAGNADRVLREQERRTLRDLLLSSSGERGATLVYFADEAEARLLQPHEQPGVRGK